MKFKIGDIVKQTKSGYNTNIGDTGKEAVVTGIGLHYLRDDDGITIQPTGDWGLRSTLPRGEDAFKLVKDKSNEKPNLITASLRQIIAREVGKLNERTDV